MHDGVARIAGGVEDRQARIFLARLGGEHPAVAGTGKHNVGEEEIDAGILVQHPKSLVRVAGFDHAIAEFLEHLFGVFPHAFIVLDDEDGLAFARAAVSARHVDGLAGRRRADLLGIGEARQVDLHRRALTLLAIDAHMAARLLDEAVHHGEAEA